MTSQGRGKIPTKIFIPHVILILKFHWILFLKLLGYQRDCREGKIINSSRLSAFVSLGHFLTEEPEIWACRQIILSWEVIPGNGIEGWKLKPGEKESQYNSALLQRSWLCANATWSLWDLMQIHVIYTLELWTGKKAVFIHPLLPPPGPGPFIKEC